MEYEALVDFEAVEANELTIRVGDVIVVTDTSNEHWWYGRLNHNEDNVSTSNNININNMNNDNNNPLLLNTHSTIDTCLEKLKNVSSSSFANGADTTDQLRLEARCEGFRPAIVDRIQQLTRENQQLSAAITKYNQCIAMYQKSTMENYPTAQGHYPRPI